MRVRSGGRAAVNSPDHPTTNAGKRSSESTDPSRSTCPHCQPSASTPPTLGSDRGEWFRVAVAAVARRASRPGRFTFYEAAKEGDVPEPGHKNWPGIAMGIAAHEGIVVRVDACPSLRPRTSKSLVRVWIGAKFAEAGEAA